MGFQFTNLKLGQQQRRQPSFHHPQSPQFAPHLWALFLLWPRNMLEESFHNLRQRVSGLHLRTVFLSKFTWRKPQHRFSLTQAKAATVGIDDLLLRIKAGPNLTWAVYLWAVYPILKTVSMYVCMHVCGICEVGGQLVRVGSSFHHVYLGNWIQIIRIGGSHGKLTIVFSPECSIYKAIAYSTLLSKQCRPTMSWYVQDQGCWDGSGGNGVCWAQSLETM